MNPHTSKPRLNPDMCESTIVLPRPKRRSSVQVEKALVEKVCLTLRHSDDEEGSSTTSTAKPKDKDKPGETGRLQKLKELHTAFGMLDENNDGRVSFEELQGMLARMGFDIPPEALNIILADKKTSSTGEVSLSELEFLQWIDDILSKGAGQSSAEDIDQDMIAAFKIFDTDGDGYITREELRRAMITMGEDITEDELDEILRHTDADRDGRIDYEEFLAALT